MEMPIYQAMDTTENWNKSETALGKSELAIEVTPEGTKRLLIGDGQPVGAAGGVSRLRAQPSLMGLPDAGQLDTLIDALDAERERAENAENGLQTQVDGRYTKEKTDELLATEAQTRANGDSNLQTQVNNRPTISDMNVCDYNTRTDAIYEANAYTNEQVGSLALRIDGLEGIGGYLPAKNFGDLLSYNMPGSARDNQLTQYALEQIPSLDGDQSKIWNGTRVKNLYDNSLWVLNNTPNTVPEVFEWVYDGIDTVEKATENTLGLVKGSAETGKVSVDTTGKMTANGLAGHLSNTNNPHGVTKAQVGLGNVSNDAQVKRAEMGTANGVATLGADGKVPGSQLPAANISITDIIAGNGIRVDKTDPLRPVVSAPAAPTFVVDSDEKLAQLVNGTAGNDYSWVHVKTGTWTYTCLDNSITKLIDIAARGTSLITGEKNSVIYFNITYSGSALFYGIHSVSNQVHVENIKIKMKSDTSKTMTCFYFVKSIAHCEAEVNAASIGRGFYSCKSVFGCSAKISSSSGTSSCFSFCNDLINCSATVSSLNSGTKNGFSNCSKLFNCSASIISTDTAIGFSSCDYLIFCFSEAITTASTKTAYPFNLCNVGIGCRAALPGAGYFITANFNSCYMDEIALSGAWANTAAGGYNRQAE
jgi:hypothetical protein